MGRIQNFLLKFTDLYLNRLLHNLSRLSFINYDALNEACIHQKFCNEKNHLEVISQETPLTKYVKQTLNAMLKVAKSQKFSFHLQIQVQNYCSSNFRHKVKKIWDGDILNRFYEKEARLKIHSEIQRPLKVYKILNVFLISVHGEKKRNVTIIGMQKLFNPIVV